MGIRDRIRDLRGHFGDRYFDPKLVRDHVIDTGEQGRRAKRIAERLNGVRDGAPKKAVVVWKPDYSAITRRGPWVYVSRELAERLSDDGLASVIAHEMAHHDLGHLRLHMAVAAHIGFSQEMELQADRAAIHTCVRAGYDPRGALEALDPERWDPVERPAREDWPETVRWWVERLTQSHPDLHERAKALEREIAAVGP